MRKQPTFRNGTNDFPAKWRVRNERRNSILLTRHYPHLGSPFDLINWKFASTNQQQYQIRVVHVISMEFLRSFLEKSDDRSKIRSLRVKEGLPNLPLKWAYLLANESAPHTLIVSFLSIFLNPNLRSPGCPVQFSHVSDGNWMSAVEAWMREQAKQLLNSYPTRKLPSWYIYTNRSMDSEIDPLHASLMRRIVLFKREKPHWLLW